MSMNILTVVVFSPSLPITILPERSGRSDLLLLIGLFNISFSLLQQHLHEGINSQVFRPPGQANDGWCLISFPFLSFLLLVHFFFVFPCFS